MIDTAVHITDSKFPRNLPETVLYERLIFFRTFVLLHESLRLFTIFRYLHHFPYLI